MSGDSGFLAPVASDRAKLYVYQYIMALADFLAELDELARRATKAFAAAQDAAALEAARIEFVGARSGRLKDTQKALGQVDKADKPAAGKRFNKVKQQIEAALAETTQRLAQKGGAKAEARQFDPTVPGKLLRLGHLHPITETIEEIKDIMGRLGFTVADGPEVEDHWHNFEALNIPLEHPAAIRWTIFIWPWLKKQSLGRQLNCRPNKRRI